MQANNEKTELALKQASNEVSVFVVDVEKEVAAIEDQYLSVVPDCSTKKGYEYSKSVRGEVLPIKSGIETARKTLKAPVIEMGKLIDSSLKPLIDRLELVYKPHEEAYRAKDNEKKLREEARQAQIQAAFDKMNQVLMDSVGQSSTVIETYIDDLADLDLNPDVFQERREEAAKKHVDIMGKLSDMLTSKIAEETREAEAEAQRQKIAEIEAREAAIRKKEEAEANRIQDEIDAKARAEREEEIRKQAAIEAEERHKAALEAQEQRAIEQAKQAEINAKRQAEAAAQAEREHIEQERLAEEENARKREANKAHKTKINREILTAILTTGITEKQAKAIICLAAKGEAGNMKVFY